MTRSFFRRILFDCILNRLLGPRVGEPIPIHVAGTDPGSVVEERWTRHTIYPGGLITARQSERYIDEIDRLYPFYFELCGLYDAHEGETILDYGCGPGNDLTGYFLRSKAAKIIGVDVSLTALEQARTRRALHGATADRITLIKIGERKCQIPLPDASVDYAQCLGVLHHVSDPVSILSEIRRVLKPGRYMRAMVYNHNSLYLHLTVSFDVQIVTGRYAGMSAYEAFQTFSDAGAPISRCYVPEQFCELAERAGMRAEFVDAYFSLTELESWKRSRQKALEDRRFPKEHRDFLCEIVEIDGWPKYRGRNAGLGAIFKLYRNS